MHSHTFSPHDVRAIAVHAKVDPRTVRRFLEGWGAKSSLEDRIMLAIIDLGWRLRVPVERDLDFARIEPVRPGEVA